MSEYSICDNHALIKPKFIRWYMTIASENNFRDQRLWALRLILSSLYLLSSILVASQTPLAAASTIEDNGSQLVLAIAPAPGTVAFGDTYRNIIGAKKQSHRSAGPDSASGVQGSDELFTFNIAIGIAADDASSEYVAEHILFRNGTRAIATHAPPARITS